MMETRSPDATNAAGFPAYCDRGHFRFYSGATATHFSPPPTPATMPERVEHEHIRQARVIFDGFEDATKALGGLMSLGRLHLYQQDKRTFPLLERVRIEREGDQPAPSSGIGVANLRDELTIKWEIDCIGLSDRGFEAWGTRERVADGAAGRSASHYSQAVRLGPYYFLAGMIPIDVETGSVVMSYADIDPEDRWFATGRSHTDARRGPIVSQTVALFRRIFATLESLDCGKEDIVNCTMFISNPLDFADAARVYEKLFDGPSPALQAVVVDEVGHKGTIIEIECTVSISGGLTRIENPRIVGVPAAVEAEHLAYFSDQVGVASDGRYAADPLEFFAEDQVAWSGEHCSRLGVPPLSDEVVAQTGRALANLEDAIEASSRSLRDVGFVHVQVQRPYPVTAVAALIGAYFGDAGVAGTVLSVDGLAYGPGASLAIAAVAG